jgi:hypothetical protein
MGKSLVAQAANEVLRELLKQTKRWPYVSNKVRPRSHSRGSAPASAHADLFHSPIGATSDGNT